MRPRPPVLAGGAVAARAAFGRPLPGAFYDRPTVEVALDLLGRPMVRRDAHGYRAVRIVETEAYPSFDRANHADRGPTVRNRAMFGPPGTLYVYRIHQVHCLNAVTGHGTAVLVRAAEPLEGIEGDPRGPGRLCRALAIGPAENGTSLVDGPLRVVRGTPRRPSVVRGPRVGISRDVDRPYRFAIGGNPWVSRPLPPAARRARA